MNDLQKMATPKTDLYPSQFRCRRCIYETASESRMLKHAMKVHIAHEDCPVRCMPCRMGFASWADGARHGHQRHPRTDPTTYLEENTEVPAVTILQVARRADLAPADSTSTAAVRPFRIKITPPRPGHLIPTLSLGEEPDVRVLPPGEARLPPSPELLAPDYVAAILEEPNFLTAASTSTSTAAPAWPAASTTEPTWPAASVTGPLEPAPGPVDELPDLNIELLELIDWGATLDSPPLPLLEGPLTTPPVSPRYSSPAEEEDVLMAEVIEAARLTDPACHPSPESSATSGFESLSPRYAELPPDSPEPELFSPILWGLRPIDLREVEDVLPPLEPRPKKKRLPVLKPELSSEEWSTMAAERLPQALESLRSLVDRPSLVPQVATLRGEVEASRRILEELLSSVAEFRRQAASREEARLRREEEVERRRRRDFQELRAEIRELSRAVGPTRRTRKAPTGPYQRK